MDSLQLLSFFTLLIETQIPSFILENVPPFTAGTIGFQRPFFLQSVGEEGSYTSREAEVGDGLMWGMGKWTEVGDGIGRDLRLFYYS